MNRFNGVLYSFSEHRYFQGLAYLLKNRHTTCAYRGLGELVGCLAVVAQWQSTGGSIQGYPVFDSQ